MVKSVSEIVEAVTPQQIDQARSLFREYRAQLPWQLCTGDFEGKLRALPAEYTAPRGKLLLATVVGQPAGCVGLRPFPLNGACEMKHLYVRPPFRAGKLGKALVDRVLEEARNLRYRYVRLDTHPPTMRAALDLYRRLGFQEVAAAPLTPVEGLLYLELALDG
jgi:GNAT superfamily N-acetyltransferase